MPGIHEVTTLINFSGDGERSLFNLRTAALFSAQQATKT
jgi:hypothetical protein